MRGSRSIARRASGQPGERRSHAGPPGPQATGAVEAAHWLVQRRLSSTSMMRWHVEIALDIVDRPAPVEFDDRTATRFHIDLYSEEWGVFFCHGGRASWVRVTDIAFVHGRDDFGLLPDMPDLKDLGPWLRQLEHQHGVQFQRGLASVRTNLANAEPAIRRWIASL